jgi:CHASE1-domain containing sensor protein
MGGGVAAMRSHNNDMNNVQWSRYANALNIDKKYPGINGIGVIHHISPAKLELYLSKERQDRLHYQIHPAHNQNEYFPITYIEPVDSNAKAVGLDMAHETNRYIAAKKARTTGEA